MGQIESIFLSKVCEVQDRLNSHIANAGFPEVNFSSIFIQKSAALQPSPASVSQSGIQQLSSKENSEPYDDIIQQAADKNGLDPNLLKAVIRTESSFRKDAVSSAGAMGLMQLMPGTAESLGVTDAFDAEQNVNGGAAYLKKLLDRFGDIRLALAAYNTGPGRVASLQIADPDDASEYSKLSGGVRGYVNKVMSYYSEYSNSSTIYEAR